MGKEELDKLWSEYNDLVKLFNSKKCKELTHEEYQKKSMRLSELQEKINKLKKPGLR